MNLFIDTSFSKVILALTKEDKIVKYIEENNDQTLSDRIFIMMERLFEGQSRTNISKIFVASGPGSFTGVRIGVTIAKTIAWSLNVPVIPVSSLEVLASTISNEDGIVVYMDARRGNVFGGIYDNQLNPIVEDAHISYEELLLKVPEGNIIYSSHTILDEKFPVISPRVNVLSIIQKHKDDIPVNTHELVPNYLKLTEAEENLKKKNDNKNN